MVLLTDPSNKTYKSDRPVRMVDSTAAESWNTMKTVASKDSKQRIGEHLDRTVTEYSYFAPAPETMDGPIEQ